MAGWPRRWRARWIWWEQPGAPGTNVGRAERRDGFGYLRKTFELDAPPHAARCRITADSRYVLWVNGALVGRGPIRSEPSHLTYDDYELSDRLVAGRNVVAVLARAYGTPTLSWKPPVPVWTLGFGSLLFEADIDGRLVVSDGTWRAREAAYRRASRAGHSGPPPLEVIDGMRTPRDWAAPGFDDSAWDPAVIVEAAGLGAGDGTPPTEPFGLLGPRPVLALTERRLEPARIVGRGIVQAPEAEDPLEARAAEQGLTSVVDESWRPLRLDTGQTITVDMGGIVDAHPELVVAADTGTVVDLACGEDLTEAGRAVIEPRRWAMRYTASGRGNESAASFEPVGFRYLEATVRAGAAAELSLSATEVAYPRPPGASFACSDELLTTLWSVGARTLDLCSTDAYLDCPGREQRAWLGDAYVHTLVSLVCNPDPGLATWNLRLHAQGTRSDGLMPMVAAGDFTDLPLTIPDYSLHWIRTLARIWEHTGDAGLVAELLPTGMRALDWFERHRGPDGLLVDLEGWIFIDWAQNERGRQTAAVDALYVLALDDMASLARAAGDTGLARRCRERARATRKAFGRYWDRRRRVYVDAADPEAGPGTRVSQHTNALALLARCAPRGRWEAMLARVLDPARLVRTLTPGDAVGQDRRHRHQFDEPDIDEDEQVVLAQPFFAHFVHQAVATAGRAQAIPELCRRWRPLVERGNGCLEEYWTADPGLGSRCHAWSATPTYDLSTHVLGVRPAEPGYATVAVTPELGDLSWAEGSVPTPRGFVRVRAERDGPATVALPDGMTGILTWRGRTAELGAGTTALH